MRRCGDATSVDHRSLGAVWGDPMIRQLQYSTVPRCRRARYPPILPYLPVSDTGSEYHPVLTAPGQIRHQGSQTSYKGGTCANRALSVCLDYLWQRITHYLHPPHPLFKSHALKRHPGWILRVSSSSRSPDFPRTDLGLTCTRPRDPPS